MELEAWKQSMSLDIPSRSDDAPKRTRISCGDLVLPSTLSARNIHGLPISRNPGGGAVSIEVALLTADRESFGALGLVFIAYALSGQKDTFRLYLGEADGELSQIVLWPRKDSSLEALLGFRQQVSEVHYRPKLPEGNPNYTTVEQDDEKYPREHLPYCRLGAADVEGGGITRQNEPVCLHFRGTGQSLVWLGKYFLNLALSDNNSRLAYLYNFDPAESLAEGSAELRLTIANSGKPELFPP